MASKSEKDSNKPEDKKKDQDKKEAEQEADVNYEIKIKEGHDNDLLDELRFLYKDDTKIVRIPHLSTINEATEFPDITTPLMGDIGKRSVEGGTGFLPEQAFIVKNTYIISTPIFWGPKPDIESLRRFLRAGPRKNLYFKPEEVRACIVTGGGLCPGLNAAIRELVNTLYYNYKVEKIYGIKYGYKGFFDYEWEELNPKAVKDIHHLGGTYLGTSRGGFDLEKIMDSLIKNKINQVYCLGGDGMHKGINVLFKEISRRKLNIAICGIPKTIDNDIPIIDKSFGFDTAVEEATKAIASANTEANSAEYGIGLVKLMGRTSGFIAMMASLANGDVNICLVPEFNFELGGDHGLLEFIVKRLKAKQHCVIVVAEGAGSAILDEKLEAEGTDASGNPKLPDVGKFIKDKITEYCKKKNIDVTLKYIDPTYMVRTTAANALDQEICRHLAQNAVHGAMAGFTGFTSGNLHNMGCYIPLSEVTSGKNQIDLENRSWQRLLASTGQPSFLNGKKIEDNVRVDKKVDKEEQKKESQKETR